MTNKFKTGLMLAGAAVSLVAFSGIANATGSNNLLLGATPYTAATVTTGTTLSNTGVGVLPYGTSQTTYTAAQTTAINSVSSALTATDQTNIANYKAAAAADLAARKAVSSLGVTSLYASTLGLNQSVSGNASSDSVLSKALYAQGVANNALGASNSTLATDAYGRLNNAQTALGLSTSTSNADAYGTLYNANALVVGTGQGQVTAAFKADAVAAATLAVNTGVANVAAYTTALNTATAAKTAADAAVATATANANAAAVSYLNNNTSGLASTAQTTMNNGLAGNTALVSAVNAYNANATALGVNQIASSSGVATYAQLSATVLSTPAALSAAQVATNTSLAIAATSSASANANIALASKALLGTAGDGVYYETQVLAALNDQQTAISANTTAITNEVTRATAAEAALTTSIANEASRATAAENALGVRVTTETSRALAAEAALGTRIDTLGTQITNEVNRAKAEELRLDKKINASTAMAAALSGNVFLPNTKFNLSGNIATYNSATAASLQGAFLVSKNVALHGGAAFNIGGGSAGDNGVVARAGVTFGW